MTPTMKRIFQDRKKKAEGSSLLKTLLSLLPASEIADSQFDAEQLKKGTLVEMEHTSEREVAKAIAKAHLQEDENYYEKLERAGL